MNSTIGKLLIFIGFLFVFLGIIFLFSKNIPIGRLPGDIYVKKDNFSFYFPITTMIVISIIISFLIYLIGKK
ncbi:MAG TPA: DUF2905 domain-containing protein [Candidatus Goldiibacteriota bacterium]|nr:DUF2905 domain-containing protein [Candidatus Goldiibacteriota bacterium]